MSRELGDLSPVLASATISHSISLEYEEMGFSIDSGVEILVKEHDGIIYLLTANTTVGPAKVTFSNLPSAATSLDVLSENRSLSVSKNSFQDSFDPYQVHIYKARKE